MTSKLVVNTIEADTGISSVSFASSISMDSTSKFHFSAAGVDIGADTNINRPAAGVLGFNISGAEKLRIDTNGHLNTSGIVTAANFKSGVTNVHNLGVTLTGGQLDVGSNIKIGTAGVVTATSFVGSGANLTSLPAQATIANNSDNRVITGGSGVNLNGEANFTFDGTIATIQNSGAVSLNIGSTNAGGASITLDGDSNGDFVGNDYSIIRHSTDGHLVLHTKNPAGASNVFIQMGTSNHYGAMFKEGAESLLRYNNSTKIETTNTGALITGNLDLAADGDTILLGTGDDFQISFDGTNGVLKGVTAVQNINIWTENTAKYQFTTGALRPLANNSYDLGDTSLRWRNIYTNDLNLSNQGSTNTVDNTWGDYTIQEGESDLFLINNRNGKKYKFNLTEVS